MNFKKWQKKFKKSLIMNKLTRIFLLMAGVVALASCSNGAKIDFTLVDAPDAEVVIKVQDINKYTVVDTLKTNAKGEFSYKLKLEKDQPDFAFFYYKGARIASLLLERGDRVKVVADTLGSYSVTGSKESELLAQVEADYSAIKNTFAQYEIQLQEVSSDNVKLAELGKEMSRVYVDYYRGRVKYIMSNARSLTIIPVLYQSIGNLPVFAQQMDAILFRNLSDSLAIAHPKSKYVKSLKAEAEKRFQGLELETRLKIAEEIGFPEINLPNIKGENVKLSEVDAKVILLHFWNSADQVQKMLNLDVLLSVYKDYHLKGFEIYQVSMSPNKVLWAEVVDSQNLPWISVCDIRGNASPYLSTYNLSSLPQAFIIHDGSLVEEKITDEKSLRDVLNRRLK